MTRGFTHAKGVYNIKLFCPECGCIELQRMPTAIYPNERKKSSDYPIGAFKCRNCDSMFGLTIERDYTEEHFLTFHKNAFI